MSHLSRRSVRVGAWAVWVSSLETRDSREKEHIKSGACLKTQKYRLVTGTWFGSSKICTSSHSLIWFQFNLDVDKASFLFEYNLILSTSLSAWRSNTEGAVIADSASAKALVIIPLKLIAGPTLERYTRRSFLRSTITNINHPSRTAQGRSIIFQKDGKWKQHRHNKIIK